MNFFGTKIKNLQGTDIENLITNQVAESKILDYKRDLNLTSDKEKRELVSDIAAMANAEGGCLIYGIEEKKDAAGQNTGLPASIIGVAIPNEDKLLQQIEHIISANTDPSIAFLDFKCVQATGKDVLIIGVPKNLGLPAMVTLSEINKFFKRRNSGRYAVDVQELYQMFLHRQQLTDSIEDFRKTRISKVRSFEVIDNLDISTSFFIQIIPFNFLSGVAIDVSHIEHKGILTLMRPLNLSGWDHQYNADGILTWHTRLNPSPSYDALFRNGIYECYTSSIFERRELVNNKTLFCMYAFPFVTTVIGKIKEALEVLKKFNVEPPFSILISMIGMKGAVIYSPATWGRPFTTNELLLPPVTISSYGVDIYASLKTNFDIIWQAASEPESPPYLTA